MRRPVLLCLAALACNSFSEPARQAPPTPRDPAEVARQLGATLPSHPDLLIVTFDTTRADHVSAYGYPRQTTPWFDAFAATGVLFERYLVPMATTLPSHTSLFTGVQPLEHGVIANADFTGERFIPPDGLLPIASLLARGGYATGGFVSSAPLKRASGIARDFAGWDQPDKASRRAQPTTDAALAWLKTVPPGRPVFLWVHYLDPHRPYTPLDDLADLFDDDDTIRQHFLDRHYGKPSQRKENLARLNAYDAELVHADRQFGRLLQAWDDSGRAHRSVVLVAGDHGEGLMQHGELEHGNLWDEQLHTLAALRAPGLTPRRHPTDLSAADLLPTVFGFADFPGEAAFLAMATGHDALAPGAVAPPVLSRTSLKQVHQGERLGFALTEGRWKFVLNSADKRWLFDLQTDPHELDDVADEHPEVVARMEGRLREMRAEQQARGEAMGAGRTEKLSEEMRLELSELGYLE
jgi:arylsulfatase A-like enzyme